MPWSTYGDAASGYGTSTNAFGAGTPVPSRLYGDSTYGDGNYGESAAFSQIGAIRGPIGDSDLAYLPMIEQPLTYPSGWAPYPGYQEPRVFRDRQGFCHLSGVFVGPGNFAAGSVAAYLPFGFWPQNRVMVPCFTGNPMNQGRLDINNSDGSLAINSTQPAGVTYMSCSMMWYARMPPTYVIDGLLTKVENDRKGTTANDGYVRVSWTAGHLWDSYYAVSRVIPAGSYIFYHSQAYNSGYWFYVTMAATGTISYSGSTFTTENAALQDYWQGPSNAILVSWNCGVTPVYTDRRWLPYAAGPVLV